MEKHAEILAPAGGEAQLRAAVLCGADAVYLGLRGFNARAGAENFDENTLPQTVGWCHARGVRVYVTLNTLVTDRELPQWLHSLDAVAAAGVDGVLVQDLGLAKIIRQRYPTLPLHASTQMTIHNLAGARLLEEMGFAQVVLARELSKEEIAAICAGTSMRCEVFVHGALCMSVSGQCYLSSVLGERSGNRGRCAQPCRLDFKSHGRGYALSLKDLTLTDRLRELEALGVASFKIEGRLKRPEYVAAAVTACRQSLAGEVPDLETLQSVFSRSGFTDGYYTARRDLTMFGTRTREDAAAAAAVLGKLSALTRNEVGRLPVDMVLTMAPGEPATLAVTDGTHRVEVAGEVPQTALTRPTDEELAHRALEKCGGTPFYLQNLTCHIGEGLMLPLSALNRLRAAALIALALAFVICYNMGLMNFTERTRDYATLKVLGYHQREIRRLMMRETWAVSLLGTALGVYPGILLTRAVLSAINSENMVYTAHVAPMSILVASLITLAFSLCIERLLTRKVHGINMVEALKSVE